MQQLTNPYAPPAINGMNANPPAGMVDVEFEYVYDVTLSGNQFLRDQTMPTTNDADFAWWGINVNAATGAFSVRFTDSQGYYLANGMVLSANIQGDPSSPYPVFPEIIIPAGGRIGIDIQDLTGVQNVIEIGFRGVKRYKIS